MKKFILFLLLVSFFSCNNVDLSKPKYQSVSVINDQIKIRMSIPEFLDIAGHRAVKSYEKTGQQYIVFQYDEDDVWHGTDDFGASLKSFQKMLGNKGYHLVGCNITGANAFFVKKELINEKFLNNFSSEFHYEPLRIWLIKKYENELKVSI